jgi:hypothetical protein
MSDRGTQFEKPSGQFLGLSVMSHCLGEVCIRIRDSFVLFFFIFVSFRESRLLVSWCAGRRCGIACSDEDHGRSRRTSAEDQGWSHRSGTRWPGSRVVPCKVYIVHMETRSADFLVEP